MCSSDLRLIVLDEVSMVGDQMACDLMSFGKPILVVGDPGQLPPIQGEGAFTKDMPDVMLTEIHRQAAESAVIRLATMARQGEPIGFGRNGIGFGRKASLSHAGQGARCARPSCPNRRSRPSDPRPRCRSCRPPFSYSLRPGGGARTAALRRAGGT